MKEAPESWTLTIDDAVTESANRFMRRHWAARKKQALAWSWLLAEAGLSRIPKAQRPRRVRIWRESPGRIDKANLWLAADKLILDQLVKAGVLIDDDPAHCEAEVIPVQRSKKRTIIEIEDIPA